MHTDDSRENAFATREQELLLQAALLKGDPALEAWRRWWDLVDFEKEMDAGSFRLLPLLFHNLKKHDVVHPVMDRLKGLYRHAWYNNHRLFFELSGILKCLHAAGIPTMVLKGAALTVQVYKNHAIRPMADIDILVPQDRAILANALLTRAGWAPLADRPLEKDLKYRHSLNFANTDGFEFDLHWHPVKDSSIVASERQYDAAFWRNAVPIKIVEEPTLAPDRPEALLLSVVHGSWGNIVPPIRWIADAVYLIDAFNGRTDWDRFISLVRHYSVPHLADHALRYLNARFNAGIPSAVFEALRRMEISFVHRLAFHNCTKRSPMQLYTLAQRLPGVVEYLRVSGNRGLIKLVSGFPEYVAYRMRNKKINDLVGYVFAR